MLMDECPTVRYISFNSCGFASHLLILYQVTQTRTPSTLFTDERSGEVTALEVIGVSDLLGELEELK
jgi:hypothetical protein